MTISRDVIDPVRPRDINRLKAEGRVLNRNSVELGDVVVRNGPQRIQTCDARVSGGGTPSSKQDLLAPAELVWVDPQNRFDVPVVREDGVEVYQLTTLSLNCIAEVKIDEVFENTSYKPTRGDYVFKSTDNNSDAPGKLQIVDPSEAATIISSLAGTDDEAPMYFDGLKVGRVEGAGEEGPGYARVKFSLV